MTEDEFDRLIKERHRRFVEDLDAHVGIAPVELGIPVARSADYDALPAMAASVLESVTARGLPRAWDGVAATIGMVVSAAAVLVAVFVIPVHPAEVPRAGGLNASCLSVGCGSHDDYPDARGELPPLPQVLPTRSRPRDAGDPLVEGSGNVASLTPVERWDPLTLSVSFFADSARPLPGSDEILSRVAERTRPGSRIVIVGHAARQGPAEGAYELSLLRAESVRDQLVRIGLSDSDMHLWGVGFDQAGDVREGISWRDRRVDVTVNPPGA